MTPSKTEIQAAIKIQFHFRMFKEKRESKKIKHDMLEKEWENFINKLYPKPNATKQYLLSMPKSDRNEFPLWKKYLRDKDFSEDTALNFSLIQAKL